MENRMNKEVDTERATRGRDAETGMDREVCIEDREVDKGGDDEMRGR